MRPCRSRSAVRWRVRLRVGLRRALVDSTFLSLSGAETRCSSWARRHARASAQARVQGNGRLWRQPARVRCRRTRMMMQMGRHSRSPPASKWSRGEPHSNVPVRKSRRGEPEPFKPKPRGTPAAKPKRAPAASLTRVNEMPCSSTLQACIGTCEHFRRRRCAEVHRLRPIQRLSARTYHSM